VAHPLLSASWLDDCNRALATLRADPELPATLAVTELIADAPEGRLDAVTLVADVEGVRLVAGGDDRATAWLTLAFADAEALHEGRLDPATALGEGRVRVRGDLHAVVVAAGLLAAAHAVLRGR